MEFFENYYYLKVYFIHIERSLRFLLLLFSCQAVSYSSQPHGLQHTRLPCPSLSPRVCSNSCPLSQRCHPTISSFAALFSFCLQSFSASRSFPMSWLFTSGGQTIGISVSASVLPVNFQDWAGSSVYGILQAKIWEWVAIPSSRGSSRPRDWTWISCIAGRFFTVCLE